MSTRGSLATALLRGLFAATQAAAMANIRRVPMKSRIAY
jgi:hypothetical protein